MQKKLAIIGAGDLGQLLAHYLSLDSEFGLVGFYDDFAEPQVQRGKLKVLGGLNKIKDDFTNKFFDVLLMGIGYKHLAFRRQIFDELSAQIPFAKFIHPSCHVDSSAQIGDGTVLLPGCIIDRQVKIGANCLLNLACSISHDSQIDDNCFLAPRVAVAGFVKIGADSFFGINSTVIDNLSLCPSIQSGGGSVIINNITEAGLYVGVPAKLKTSKLKT